MSRGDLTDTEWRILNPLLPDRGERGPAIADKRRTMNGILWVLRTGAPWRDLPERYGNWNSAFVRFSRWSKLGVWDAVFETLASLGPPRQRFEKEAALREAVSKKSKPPQQGPWGRASRGNRCRSADVFGHYCLRLAAFGGARIRPAHVAVRSESG